MLKRALRRAVVAWFIVGFVSGQGPECSSEDFSIQYSGQSYFTVSRQNNTCACQSFHGWGEATLSSLRAGPVNASTLSVAAGATVTGTVQAGSFAGNGANLTHLHLNAAIAQLNATVAACCSGGGGGGGAVNTSALAAMQAQIDALQATVSSLQAQMSVALQMPCKFQSDCGSGYFCATNGGRCKKGTGMACTFNSECMDGLTCTGGNCSTPLGSCAHIAARGLATIDGSYVVNPTIFSSNPVAGYATVVACDMSIDGGGWTQLLNIRTADGNLVDWSNTNFWFSPTALGGAQRDPFYSMTKDYKNTELYPSMTANQLMVKVHSNGQSTLAWRDYHLARTNQPLVSFFNGSIENNPLTRSIINTMGISNVPNDPVIYSNYQLFTGTCTGNGSPDMNRLSWLAPGHTSCGSVSNIGWGIGTNYDTAHQFCTRPCADAIAYNFDTWAGGLIGTDINSINQYATNGGIFRDYAIYVRTGFINITCTQTSQCPVGMVCSPSKSICTKRPTEMCGSSLECFDTLTCTNDVCTGSLTLCTRHADCPANQLCSAVHQICKKTSGTCSSMLDCMEGTSCSSGSCTAPLASCAAVLAAGLSLGDGTYAINPTLLASPNPSFSLPVVCDMSTDAGGWNQVFNVRTSDGNILDYSNTDFWLHSTNLGGAQSETTMSYSRDYKNAYLFTSMKTTQILVKIHLAGSFIAARSYFANVHNQPLQPYFSVGTQNLRLTSQIRTTIGAVPVNDPVVYSNYNLYTTTCTGNGSPDYNRLSWLTPTHSGCGSSDNLGWGLGTYYDQTIPTCTRPCADAVGYSYATWGGGLFGGDMRPSSPYGPPVTIYRDYAIFVRETFANASCTYTSDCPAGLFCSANVAFCRKPVAEKCTFNWECFDGTTCVSGVCGGAYATCDTLHTAQPTLLSGTYMINPTLVTGSPSSTYYVVAQCEMSFDGGGYTMVMNIDTNDGNILQYDNTNFWTDASSLGGSDGDPLRATVRDYKLPYFFTNINVRQILIKVNNDAGITQYQRSWNLVNTNQPLRYYFNGWASSTNLQMTNSVRTTSGTPPSSDPVIQSSYNLFAQTCTGNGSPDLNRLSWLVPGHSGCGGNDNLGWGIGTFYDTSTGYCTRPCADAVAYGCGTWGGCVVGTDINGARQYGTNGGLYNSYAIYVK